MLDSGVIEKVDINSTGQYNLKAYPVEKADHDSVKILQKPVLKAYPVDKADHDIAKFFRNQSEKSSSEKR